MLRKFLILSGVLLVILIIASGSAYIATQQVPDFYEESLAADPIKASNEMFNRTNELIDRSRTPGKWDEKFTAKQINGFLAVDLLKQFPKLLDGPFKDPRIAIIDGEMVIACRYFGGQFSSVLSLTVDVYMHEPNIIAIHIKKARSGSLPLPLGKVTNEMTKAALKSELPLEWRTQDGDPVALFDIDRIREEEDHQRFMETLELRDGEVFVSGETK